MKRKNKDNNKKGICFYFRKNLKALQRVLPMFFAIVLFISLVKVWFPKAIATTHNIFLDAFLFNTLGSVLAGNAVNSYVIAEQLLKSGATLYSVLVFILAWVTVGFVQLPAEMVMLNKKIAIWRNIIAYISNFIVPLIVIILLQMLG